MGLYRFIKGIVCRSSRFLLGMWFVENVVKGLRFCVLRFGFSEVLGFGFFN